MMKKISDQVSLENSPETRDPKGSTLCDDAALESSFYSVVARSFMLYLAFLLGGLEGDNFFSEHRLMHVFKEIYSRIIDRGANYSSDQIQYLATVNFDNLVDADLI